MSKVTIIGVDLAKNVFQLHGAAADGTVVFRKKLTRVQFHKFMSDQTACTVAMEACGSAHYWAREIASFGHTVKLIAPVYVKPFVKRQKNDMADAEAIVEAAQRPTMRFVEQKTVTQQSRAVAFRTREQFIGQRTEAINALRSHLYEFGYIVPKGSGGLSRLVEIIADENTQVPDLVRDVCRGLLEQIDQLTARLARLKKQVEALAREGKTSRRLQTMPGIGPVTALAVETFAPPMGVFKRGRDFAAWLGLVPRQYSSGGKQRLGKTSNMGQRDIRRLLIIGAMSVVIAAARKGAPEGSWLARMLATKPRLLVAVALANKMARGIWAMLSKQENYRTPATLSAEGNLASN